MALSNNPLIDDVLKSAQSFKISEQFTKKLSDFIKCNYDIYANVRRLKKEELILIEDYVKFLIDNLEQSSILSNALGNVFYLFQQTMESEEKN